MVVVEEVIVVVVVAVSVAEADGMRFGCDLLRAGEQSQIHVKVEQVQA